MLWCFPINRSKFEKMGRGTGVAGCGKISSRNWQSNRSISPYPRPASKLVSNVFPTVCAVHCSSHINEGKCKTIESYSFECSTVYYTHTYTDTHCPRHTPHQPNHPSHCGRCWQGEVLPWSQCGGKGPSMDA